MSQLWGDRLCQGDPLLVLTASHVPALPQPCPPPAPSIPRSRRAKEPEKWEGDPRGGRWGGLKIRGGPLPGDQANESARLSVLTNLTTSSQPCELASYLTVLCLSFLSCEMGMLAVATSRG